MTEGDELFSLEVQKSGATFSDIEVNIQLEDISARGIYVYTCTYTVYILCIVCTYVRIYIYMYVVHRIIYLCTYVHVYIRMYITQ